MEARGSCSESSHFGSRYKDRLNGTTFFLPSFMISHNEL